MDSYLFLPGERSQKHVFWDCHLHWEFHQLPCSSGSFRWLFPPVSSFSLVFYSSCQPSPSGESLSSSFLCPIWWYLMWCQHSRKITPGDLSLCSYFSWDFCTSFLKLKSPYPQEALLECLGFCFYSHP